MRSLTCKFCGGNQFEKVKDGYECKYCHSFYPSKEEFIPVKGGYKRHSIKIMASIVSVLFVSFSLLVVNHILRQDKIFYSLNKEQNLIDSSNKNDWSESELKNPVRNLLVAELTLNQEEISKAKESVKRYGRKKAEEYTKRLDLAQQEHDQLVEERPTNAPRKDMIIENPDTGFSVLSYYRENGFFVAYVPEFTQYTERDILKIFGEPDETLTNPDKIKKNIDTDYFDDKSTLSELKILQDELFSGILTWREVRAFIVELNDIRGSNFTKELIYKKEGKPNFFFQDDQVVYVTPIPKYVYFTRIDEKYPYTGLGSYPEDFPDNYTEKGTCE